MSLGRFEQDGKLLHAKVLCRSGEEETPPHPASPDPCSPMTNKAPLHVVFTRAARRKGGVLLGHHVQTNRGTCFHCFNWDAGPKPNQLSENHRLSSKGKKKSSPFSPYLCGTFYCEEVVRSRTLSQASRKCHKTSSHNTPSLVIAALLPRGLEPTLILIFHALLGFCPAQQLDL